MGWMELMRVTETYVSDQLMRGKNHPSKEAGSSGGLAWFLTKSCPPPDFLHLKPMP